MKIAAAMILGDLYSEEELAKTLNSLQFAGFDCVYINYNGSQVSEIIADRLRKLVSDIPLVVKRFEWEDNFGLARQQSFDLVDKDTYDWVMWIDSDDIFVADDDDIKNILEDIDEHVSGVFLRYDYAIEPETRIVVVEQWRERILRTNVDWTWMHPIHEVCLGPPGCQFLRIDGAHIEHMRMSGEDRGARVRNRKIIAKAMRENPDVARYVFYFAGETMAEADMQEDQEKKATLARAAILEFTRFKEMIDTINDDYFIAQVRIAECFRMAEQWIEAIDADLETIAIYPAWPEGYIGAAKTCMSMGDYSRMRDFADIATKLSKPRTAASIESMNTGFTPWFLRAIANENLGDIETALSDYKKAKTYWSPPNDKIDEKIKELEDWKPVQEKKSKADEDRLRLKGSRQEKSIAFLTAPCPEDWHPELMAKNGSGGSELAIMTLAPMFAADGWRVTVFGTPGTYRGVHTDGVEYWSSHEYLPTEKFSVIVSSRTYVPFKSKLECDLSVLWMHDVNGGPGLEEVKNEPGMILALTPWHKQHLMKLYGLSEDKLAIMPNGVDLSRFPKVEKGPELGSKFIWSSSYDRGLETVLGLWPLIKRNLPDATLDIFYGWNIYDKTVELWKDVNPAQAEHMAQYKKKIISQMQWLGVDGDSGITEHGRVDQNTLAEYMLASDVWPYPTNFMETFCITAIEMQAAGVIPITSRLAALNDNIAIKELTIDGWPQNVAYQNKFVEVLQQIYSSPSDSVLEARQIGREFAETMTWENSYKLWNDLFMRMGLGSQ